MNNNFNTIVIGLGAMGSASLYQLSKRGIKTLGIDGYNPPHTFGSTHGDTRITRQAIGEGEIYTPLSLRSYEIFREIENKSNNKLLEITGGLIISSDSNETSVVHVKNFFENTLAAAKKYNIKHNILTAKDIREKFPQFKVANDEMGYYEYEAGFLRPELVITTQLKLAINCGADIHVNEKLLNFEEKPYGIIVNTDKNSYIADNLVLTVGPWIPEILSQEYNSLFKVHRQVLYWFDIADSYDDFSQLPIFIWQIKGVDNGIYGFPAVNGVTGGFKIASADYDKIVTPDSVIRDVSSEETSFMFERKVAPFFPKVKSKCIKSAVCLYTVTPDSGFVIDWLPKYNRVLLCSACSGHGFKHSTAIGEAIAQLVSTEKPTLEISALKIDKYLLCKPNIPLQ